MNKVVNNMFVGLQAGAKEIRRAEYYYTNMHPPPPPPPMLTVHM
jgi:hypothetical protein